MRFRIVHSCVARRALLRAMLGLTGVLGVWPACSSSNERITTGPGLSAGDGGSVNSASAAGHGGASCAPSNACGGSSNQVNLAVGGGTKSYGGGGTGGVNGLCQPPALVSLG